MLKANVTKEGTEVVIVGTLAELCADLSRLLSAVNEKLTENDIELGHAFRVAFTKCFMDGVCFNDDPEHMKYYLEVGNSKVKKKQELQKSMNDFLDFLNDALNDMKKFNGTKENDDEAK